jgi:hypothetical protein
VAIHSSAVGDSLLGVFQVFQSKNEYRQHFDEISNMQNDITNLLARDDWAPTLEFAAAMEDLANQYLDVCALIEERFRSASKT